MTDQNDPLEILKLENLCNVGNVRFEPHVGTGEVQTLTTAGAGGGVDAMAYRTQLVRDVLPHPATVPSAVH